MREWRRSLAEASERGSFRVAHYSLQGDHAHLIVEAQGKEALACGMKSIGARLARAVNRVSGRSGAVLDGRYHHRSLRSPREVRRALAYVLLNARRHCKEPRDRTLQEGAPRWRELGALVRRLAIGSERCLRSPGSPGGLSSAYLVAANRLETTRPDSSGGGARNRSLED